MGAKEPEETATLTAALTDYYNETLETEQCLCVMAMDGDTLVGAGAMVIRRQLGSFKNPGSAMGYTQNMYTLPAYRRRGISGAIPRMLQDGGNAMGVTAFELHATKDGEPVYIKDGFIKHNEPTYRKYG